MHVIAIEAHCAACARMNGWTWLVAVLIVLCACGNAQQLTSATRPNIILILADDLGYADLGVQGCKDVPTPNIDSIAKNGVRFTNGYVTCPTCSPSRAGLLTARYQQRFGHEFNPKRTDVQPQFGLPLSEKTMADRLKTVGYATAAFGKWHLGYKPEMHPLRRGFDEFFGFLGGMHSYVDANDDPQNPILSGQDKLTTIGYTTDELGQHAASFIRAHASEPFFVYLAFNAVHTPLAAPQKYLDRFVVISDPKRRVYAAALSAMDDNVGTVLKALRDQQLEEKTLLLFISDNGGPTSSTTSRNDPLRGQKGQVWEGGVRVPFQLQWKSHLPAGIAYKQPVMSFDATATCLAAAGVKMSPKEVDGVDLVPFLNGSSKSAPHEALYWRYGSQAAVRMGDWKLVTFRGKTELFNLRQDIGETRNLLNANIERANQMRQVYSQWNSNLAEPLWEPEPRVNRGDPAP